VDLVHEQDLTLARSEPADKLVVVRGRAIDLAAEDFRTFGIVELMRLPELRLVVLLERVGLDLLRGEVGRLSAARGLARAQRFPRAEYRGQRPSFDAECGGQTPTLTPCVPQGHIQQLLRGWVAERKLAQTMAHLALRRLQEARNLARWPART
jgi:hypothetical protein